WRPALYGVGTWSAIRGQVDPAYNSLWVSEGVDTSLLAVFDGHYLYSNTWNPPADLQATQQKFAGLVEAARHATGAGKLWVATVMPGYNDVKIRPGYGFATDREGGAYYARSWQAAITSHPNWIVITSFNEWPEGTYIEPSQAYGDLYLGLTAGWSSQFKAGGGTAALPAPVEAPDSPTAFVQTQLLNLRAGPSVDHALMGQVPAGAALPIVGRTPGGDWWQVESDQGVVWVFGELVRASGPLDDVPEVETTPAPLGSANAGEDEPDADAATEGNHPAVEDDTAVDAARAAAPGGFTLTIGDETYTIHSVRSTAP
ncbi:MAG: SH3 domain-containing protein, partial [Caldilineaceae bacterium]|nr:SH3 domain-containing protein [Caldilineaceae bacterium]